MSGVRADRSGNTPSMRRLFCLALGVFAVASGPAIAAEPVTLRDGVLRYAAGPAERSEAQVAYGQGEFTLEDGGRDRPGEGCTDFAGLTRCPHPDGAAEVHLMGGDVGNIFLLRDLTPLTRTLLLGGAGFDEFVLGPGPDRAEGRDGDDIFRASGGDDVLRGGVGDDSLAGGAGADVLDGGPGFDTAQYGDADARAAGAPAGPGLRLTPADGLANDGGPGEGDRLTGIENLFASESADVIVGGDADEDLHGMGGDDVIRAGGGDDRITTDNLGWSVRNGVETYRGRASPDVVDAGAGDDVVTITPPRDGDAADVVRCGAGRDTVNGWTPTARVRQDCEILCPAAGPGALCVPLVADLRARVSSLRVLDGRVRVPLACAPAPIAACAGTLTVTRKGETLARGRYRVARGRSAVVPATLTPRGRRALGGAQRAVRLELREAGARVRHDVRTRWAGARARSGRTSRS